MSKDWVESGGGAAFRFGRIAPESLPGQNPRAVPLHDCPLAAPGLTSYRARGRYGWIMIGARDDADALREARRSTDTVLELQIWDDGPGWYTRVWPAPE